MCVVRVASKPTSRGSVAGNRCCAVGNKCSVNQLPKVKACGARVACVSNLTAGEVRGNLCVGRTGNGVNCKRGGRQGPKKINGVVCKGVR